MNPELVREDLAARLGTIPNLNVSPFPPGSISPDAAVFQPQDIDYHRVYENGATAMTLALVLYAGLLHDQSAHQRLDQYAADTGDRSIREVLETGTYTAFDDVTVKRGEWDAHRVGGVDYLAIVFELAIFGPGG